MDARRTPERPVPGVPRHTPDPTLERGFVASLRWLVAEGEARGVRRIAVEVRALREALTTLDETRRARDEHAERAAGLDREIQAALRLLGDATRVEGNGTLVQRLVRLRDILGRDIATRRALLQERDSWRAMCEFQVRSRAKIHELLEASEQGREQLESELATMRDRMTVLTALHQETVDEMADQRRSASMAVTELARLQETAATLRERVIVLERERAQLGLLRDQVHAAITERDLARDDAARVREELQRAQQATQRSDAEVARLRADAERADIAAARANDDLTALRGQLRQWSGAVERALAELGRAALALGQERPTP
jgi:chromosome segregation ATPase